MEGQAPLLSPELHAFVLAATTVNSETDPSYVSAADTLRTRAEVVANEIANLDRTLPASAWSLRHCLVMAAAALNHPAAVAPLIGMASRALRSPDARRGESPDLLAGTAVQTHAVEALELLAASEVAGAREALVQAAAAESLAVRAVALTALRDGNGSATHFESAQSELPRGASHLAELQRVQVSDVAQIADPTLHLRNHHQRTRTPPPLDTASPSDGDNTINASRRPPRIRSERDDG
jgi:hypothetical protein